MKTWKYYKKNKNKVLMKQSCRFKQLQKFKRVKEMRLNFICQWDVSLLQLWSLKLIFESLVGPRVRDVVFISDWESVSQLQVESEPAGWEKTQQNFNLSLVFCSKRSSRPAPGLVSDPGLISDPGCLSVCWFWCLLASVVSERWHSSRFLPRMSDN